MDSETPNSNDKYLCGTTRLGRLRVFVMLAFVVVSCSGAKTPITLEQQIEIIRAKYKAAKPVSSDAQEAKPTIPQLYSVQIGDKYGYMDGSGHIVIHPIFAWAGGFSEDLALVQIPGKHLDRGFIDRTGKVLFRVNFPSDEQYNKSYAIPTNVDLFHNGLALVEIRDQRLVEFWGFIDRKGTLAIAADFEDAKRFSEGVAAIRIASPDDFSRFAAGFIFAKAVISVLPSLQI